MSQTLRKTDDCEGENEDNEGQKNDSEQEKNLNDDHSIPTMKEALEKFPDCYHKLIGLGLTTLNDLLYIDDKDLEQLCSDVLKLNLVNKIQFKSCIKQLKLLYAMKGKENTIPITMQEQKYLNDIALIGQSIDFCTKEFTDYLQKNIPEKVKEMKVNINNQYQRICDILTQKKDSLIAEIDEWKDKKLTETSHEIQKLEECRKKIEKLSTETKELLKTTKHSIEEREGKVQYLNVMCNEIIAKYLNEYNGDFIEYLKAFTKSFSIKFKAFKNIQSVIGNLDEIESDYTNLLFVDKIDLKESSTSNSLLTSVVFSASIESQSPIQNKLDDIKQSLELKYEKVSDDEKKIEAENSWNSITKFIDILIQSDTDNVKKVMIKICVQNVFDGTEKLY